MSQINLLQLVNGFAIGGGELKLLELVRHLDRQKYRITVASVGQGGPLQQEFEKLGIPVYVFSKRNRFDLSLIKKVAWLMRQQEIQVLQTTLFYADIIGGIAAGLTGVPVVISWEVVTQPLRPRHRWAYRLAQAKTDRVVTVSRALQRTVIRDRHVTPEKVITIPYGVDVSVFGRRNGSIKREQLGLQKEDLLIGVVARLTEQKGHTYLIKAAPEIVEAFPEVKFLFVGDGPLRQKLEAEVNERNLASHFRFLGFRGDVPDLLHLFDLFVLPSLYEGLPNVVLEAMAASRAVVATAVDGTPEAIVDGQTGVLVPPKNPSALGKAISGLLASPERRRQLGENARRRVETCFSLQAQVAQFEELYHSLYERKTLGKHE